MGKLVAGHKSSPSVRNISRRVRTVLSCCSILLWKPFPAVGRLFRADILDVPILVEHMIKLTLYLVFFSLSNSIPQLILTALVTSKRTGGVLSPVATFNVTTSGFNLLFNILDMFMPEDEVMFHDGTTEDYGATNQQESSNNAFRDDDHCSA
jgi:hypothetical protein